MNLSDTILDALNRNVAPASAGEITETLKLLGIHISRDRVKLILDSHVEAGRLDFVFKSFWRNGRSVEGKAYGNKEWCKIEAHREEQRRLERQAQQLKAKLVPHLLKKGE